MDDQVERRLIHRFGDLLQAEVQGLKGCFTSEIARLEGKLDTVLLLQKDLLHHEQVENKNKRTDQVAPGQSVEQTAEHNQVRVDSTVENEKSSDIEKCAGGRDEQEQLQSAAGTGRGPVTTVVDILSTHPQSQVKDTADDIAEEKLQN
ncbi:unnamed protein product, partial [Amoebophrya sp. A120]|eukprot:GSA120T00014941001.1